MKEMLLTEKGKKDLASMLALMQESVLPLRNAAYQRPDFWNIPLSTSNVRDYANSPFWQDMIVQSPQDDYNSIIRGYIATTIGTLPTTGLEFRFLLNEGRPNFVQFAAGVERHKGADYPPARFQPTHIVLAQESVFKYQVRNLTGVTQRIAAAISGWQYYQPFSPEEADGVNRQFPIA